MKLSISGLLSRVRNLGRTSPADVQRTHITYIPSFQAGVNVTHESSLGLAAVWACVRAISEPIASMPWRVMEDMEDGKVRTAKEQAADWLLHKEPNPEMTPFAFRETLIAWALTWGDGFAEVTRDRALRVAEMWPLSPDRVEVTRTQSGRLVYDIDNGAGQPNTVLDPENVFHLHGLGFDGLRGYSVIEMHRRAIALGLAMQESGSSTFGNGGVPAGIVKYATKIDAKVAADTRREWNELYSGPRNRGRIAVMGGDVDFKAITIPLQDVQYIESRQFQVEEICRIFRVPPHKIQHLLRATNNNIEHQSIEYVQDALMPWVLRLEQEANRKLFGRNQRSRFYSKINLNSLLRGDSDSRSRFYWQMFQMGVFSTNDIRELEDMGTIGPEGDKRLVQLNLTTLDRAGEPEPAPQPSDPEPADDDEVPEPIANRLNGKGATNGTY